MLTYAQLTDLQKARALKLARSQLARKMYGWMLGNDRDQAPPNVQTLLETFDARALTLAQNKSYVEPNEQIEQLPAPPIE